MPALIEMNSLLHYDPLFCALMLSVEHTGRLRGVSECINRNYSVFWAHYEGAVVVSSESSSDKDAG